MVHWMSRGISYLLYSMIIVIWRAIWFHLPCIFGPMRLHGCLFCMVLKYAVAGCVSCLLRSCECVKQIHITRALYASHAWWVYNFPRLQRSKFWLNMVSFAVKDLFSCYIKQIMNVFFSFVQWNKYFHSVKDEMFHSTRLQLGFASLNGTFHLSPHENICTIALINIHYLHSLFIYHIITSIVTYHIPYHFHIITSIVI